MTDSAIEAHIGHYVKNQRLKQNKTQSDVARAAGISRSTLSLLERGESVTLMTLIRVLRVLNLLHVFSEFRHEPNFSPIALAEQDRAKRQRARKASKSSPIDTSW